MTVEDGRIPEQRVDVVIIGAGPGGSTAASLLRIARPDLHVVVLDRARFPRPHVGESMLPNSNAVLAKLGLLEAVDAAGFVRKGGVAYKWRSGGECLLYRFADGLHREQVDDDPERRRLPEYTWQVDRSRYDALLLARAVELGAEVRQGVAVVEVLGDRERVEGVVFDDPERGRGRLLARFVVDASGQTRFLGRALGIDRDAHELGDLAIYRYYTGAGWNPDILADVELSNIFFAATRTGWIWYIPLARELVSVGLVTRRELVRAQGVDEVFESELATVPEMQALLVDATLIPEPGGEGPARTQVTQNWSYAHAEVAGPGWFLAGDAAAFVDPVLSSGVMLAHCSGLWVANAITTLLDQPELGDAIARDYGEVYAAARAAFVEMARWWYHSRELGPEDWWRQAGVLTRQTTGKVPLDDRRAFIDVLAGYLTDCRFAQIDLSFGAEALGTCLSSLAGLGPRDDDDDEDSREGDARTRRLAIRFDAVELARFYGTHVDTDRWWLLPRLRFAVAGEWIDYRPPIIHADDGQADPDAVVRTLATLLDLAEQEAVCGDVEDECHARVGDTHGLAQRMLADLLQLHVLELSDATGPLLSERGDIEDRSRALVHPHPPPQVEWRELVELGGDRRQRLPTLVFGRGDATIRYRPPVRLGRDGSNDAEPLVGFVEHLLGLCDGRRSFEDCVRAGRTHIEDAGVASERAHTLANTLLGELVTLGVLELR